MELEIINENIKNEIDKLIEMKHNAKMNIHTLDTIISNLEDYNDEIYCIFEDHKHYYIENQQLERENAVLKEYLKDKLTNNEKTELRILENIEIE